MMTMSKIMGPGSEDPEGAAGDDGKAQPQKDIGDDEPRDQPPGQAQRAHPQAISQKVAEGNGAAPEGDREARRRQDDIRRTPERAHEHALHAVENDEEGEHRQHRQSDGGYRGVPGVDGGDLAAQEMDGKPDRQHQPEDHGDGDPARPRDTWPVATAYGIADPDRRRGREP